MILINTSTKTNDNNNVDANHNNNKNNYVTRGIGFSRNSPVTRQPHVAYVLLEDIQLLIVAYLHRLHHHRCQHRTNMHYDSDSIMETISRFSISLRQTDQYKINES